MPPAILLCAPALRAKVTLLSCVLCHLPAAGTVRSGIFLVAAKRGDAGEGTWGVLSPQERGHSRALLFPRARRLLWCCSAHEKGHPLQLFLPGDRPGDCPHLPRLQSHPHLQQFQEAQTHERFLPRPPPT